MPSASELLKKHSDRVKKGVSDRPRIQRKGPTRPWQERLDQYSVGDDQPAPAEPEKVQQPIKDAPQPAPSDVVPEAAKGDARATVETFTGDISLDVGETSEGPKSKGTLPRSKSPQSEDAGSPREMSRVGHIPHPAGLPAAKDSFFLSPKARVWIEMIGRLGWDIAMKAILIQELSNDEGYVQCSQQFLASQLKVSLKTAKRLLDELCERGVIEIAREFDPGTKAPREYRFLRNERSLPTS